VTIWSVTEGVMQLQRMNSVRCAPPHFTHFMALPDHIQVKVLSHCDSVKTMLHLSETCSHMNYLLLSSPQLMKRLKLVIKFTRDNNETVNQLSTILSNISTGRKYTKLKLVYANEAVASYVKPLLLKILSLVGKSLKELEISSGTYKNLNDIAALLKCFDEVGKLTLSHVFSEDNELSDVTAILGNLKELLVIDSKSSILRIFEHFTSLHRFKFHHSARESENLFYGVRNLENFILQQSELKILDISRMHKNVLFHENIFDDRKFRLESIIANKFFLHKNNAVNFFAKQTNLKAIKLYDFCDTRSSVDYCNCLRSIFTLPSLVSVGIFNGTINIEDFDCLKNVRNDSVKHLEYDMWNSTVLEKFIDMFPRLEKISFRCFTVKLRDVSCEKLAIMQTSGYSLEEFIYQPPNVPEEQVKFEALLKNFVARNKGIKHLTIGHSSWVENNFGLSLNFWIEALYNLADLSELVIYNPLDIKLLYMLLARNKNAFKSVTFVINSNDRQLIGKFAETWLKIVVI
jgi:hypothetical protein